MYHSEFTLLRCKDICRIEDMLDDEISWWKIHLEHIYVGMFGSIEKPEDFSTPFDGESFQYLNEDIGTDQLRIRRWRWIDSTKEEHIILDMNNWPGDNKTYLIIIKDTVRIFR